MNPRVQLNISVLPEEKLALQALAEGRGLSVTRLVLSLIYEPSLVVAESDAQFKRLNARTADPVMVETAEVVARLAEERSFTPFSKETQAGRKPKERK